MEKWGIEEDISKEEIKKCEESPVYFYNKYVKIYDKDGKIIPKPDITEEEYTRMCAEIIRSRNRHRVFDDTNLYYQKIVLKSNL